MLSPLCLSLGAGCCDTPRRGLAGFVPLHDLNLKNVVSAAVRSV